MVSRLKKTKSLSFLIGPPAQKPGFLRWKKGFKFSGSRFNAGYAERL